MNIKAVLWLIAGVLVTIFVYQNAAVVEVRFLFWTVAMSRVLLIGGAMLLGFLAGAAAGWELSSHLEVGKGKKGELP